MSMVWARYGKSQVKERNSSNQLSGVKNHPELLLRFMTLLNSKHPTFLLVMEMLQFHPLNPWLNHSRQKRDGPIDTTLRARGPCTGPSPNRSGEKPQTPGEFGLDR